MPMDGRASAREIGACHTQHAPSRRRAHATHRRAPEALPRYWSPADPAIPRRPTARPSTPLLPRSISPWRVNVGADRR
jgi:hypothetical protein